MKPKNLLKFWIVLFFISHDFLLRAQETSILFFREQEKDERFEAGVPIISGILLPVFTPEMGFSIETSGVVTFKTRRNNSYLRHSLLSASARANPEKSFVINFHPEVFWLDNFVLIEINAEYRNMLDNYWGVGMEKSLDIEKSKSTTGYTRESFFIHPDISFRIANNLYGGFGFEFNSFRASDLAELMHEDPEILEYGTDIFTGGMGIIALYDRHTSFDPASYGFYVQAKGINYNKFLNSDYHFQKFEFDYRHFFPVIRKGSVAALQLKSSMGFGNIPWTDLPQPGGSYDLRGCYQGQYRDKNMLVFVAEYRHYLNKRGTESLSRHGFIYWLGAGTVFQEIAGINNAILSTGIGYRYRLQPNITLRIDIGFGTENVEIYTGLNEAF